MDPLPDPAPTQPPQPDLQAQVDRLAQLLHSVLVLAIVVSGTFSVFLYNQLRYAQKDLEQIEKAVGQYQKTTGFPTDAFVKRLATFSKTHPDYLAIAAKYGLDKAPTNGAASSTPAPSKPAPVPVKK